MSVGANAGGVIGGMLGAFGGAVFSLLLLIRFVVKSVLLLLGTYLLSHAGTANMTLKEFNMSMLIFGAIIYIVGLIIFRNKKSDSGNSSDNS